MSGVVDGNKPQGGTIQTSPISQTGMCDTAKLSVPACGDHLLWLQNMEFLFIHLVILLSYVCELITMGRITAILDRVWDRIFVLAGEGLACYPSNPAASRCLEGNEVRDLISVPAVLQGAMTELSWEMEGNGRNATLGSRSTEFPWHRHLPRLAQ